MSCALRGLAVFICAAALYAQAPSAAKQPAGLETDWEIAPVLQEISAHATRLLPVLDKVDARAWVARGASDTYVAQLQSSKEQAKAVAGEAKALAANPERLSASLEVLFRIQGLENMLGSLGEAIRKYQGAADAQTLASMRGARRGQPRPAAAVRRESGRGARAGFAGDGPGSAALPRHPYAGACQNRKEAISGPMPFVCSICGEESTRICARCTKDSCNNHLCEKCGRCSDCCECEITLSDHALPTATARSVFPKPDPIAGSTAESGAGAASAGSGSGVVGRFFLAGDFGAGLLFVEDPAGFADAAARNLNLIALEASGGRCRSLRRSGRLCEAGGCLFGVSGYDAGASRAFASQPQARTNCVIAAFCRRWL